MKKSTFLPKFQFFFCTKLTFLHQNWYWQKHLSLCLKVCTTLFYHCTWKFTHLPKNWRFWHKMLFLLKENNATKNWHFSKTEATSLRKLNISFKKNIFENGDHLLQKWKNPSKLLFLQDFRFYQWSSHNRKIYSSKTNFYFFQNWQLKYF